MMFHDLRKHKCSSVMSVSFLLSTCILPLRIETGRFVNEALDNRLCRLCNSNAVEEEIHFCSRHVMYIHV